jgi:hypothetical protein
MKIQFLILSGLILGLGACTEKSAQEPTVAAETTTHAEPAALQRSASAEGASVFFITPTDGATVSNPITIEFGIEGMEVVKAGVDQPFSGHHHLLIDTDLPDMGMPIPADEHHVHFGDGRTTTEIELSPGEHTLQMLLGDHLHIPHNPPLMSEVIRITVE